MHASPDEILVVIPARDEEETITACLESVHVAAERVTVPVRMVVAADGCSDGTVDLARPLAHVTVLEARSVGAARQAGVRAALALSSATRPWVANTDADSLVPADWLERQVEFANEGFDVVAGRVVVDDWSRWGTRVRDEYDAGYRAGRDHGHVHGTNLGFSADVLGVGGGFLPLRTGEDVDLVDRALAAGYRVAWSDVAPVVTSARRGARAPGGFAAHLADVEARVLSRPPVERPRVERPRVGGEHDIR